MKKMQKCFVSCSAKDAKLIRIFRQIVRSEIEFISCYSLGISGTEDVKYLETVPNTIQAADLFIAVLSPQSLESEQIEREISFAYNNELDTIIVYTTPFTISGPINLMLAENNMKCCLKDRYFSLVFNSFIQGNLRSE